MCRILAYSESLYSKHENAVLNGDQEKESNGIENSVPRDQRLSSLVKPRDAKR